MTWTLATRTLVTTMPAEHGDPVPPRRPEHRSRRGVAVGAVLLGALTIGWFLLSRFVAHTAARGAIREAVGVALGLLLLLSVVGAIRNGAGGNR